MNEFANKNLDDIYAGLDSAGTKGLDPSDLLQQIAKKKDPRAVEGTAQAAYNKQLDIMADMVRRFADDGQGGLVPNLKFETARELRQAIDKNTNFSNLADGFAPNKNQAGLVTRGMVNEGITSSAPLNVSRALKEQNKTVSNSINAKKAITRQLAGDIGNNRIGLGSTVAAAAAGPKGLILNELKNSYGNTWGAIAGNKVGKGLQSAGQGLQTPGVARQLLGGATRAHNTVQYATPDEEQLEAAAASSGQSYSSLVNVLSQTDPEFQRKAREKAGQE